MNAIQYINEAFAASIQAKQKALQQLAEPLAAAAELALQQLQKNGKIMLCGNGGSAADAQHCAAELIGRFEADRKGLAAIALTTDSSVLTAITNDMHYDDVFARQVAALASPDDVLIAISTSGNSNNVNRAIRQAHKLNLPVIALTGKEGGETASLMDKHDIYLCVPSSNTARIQEVHILLLHCLCGLIEDKIINV